ncbi:MAG TPA: ABC transporter permease [Gemmatimonadaceae bacterium]|nr:ABC transporter permease [Gemmatimonadaceae bacterium]
MTARLHLRDRAVHIGRALLLAAVLAAGLVSLLALVLALGGYDVPRALGALWLGSFGSRDALLSATLVRAIPLVLTGLAVALAFRAGVWNIGAEGQLLAGAAVYTMFVLGPASGLGVVALLAGLGLAAAAGAAWAGIAAALRERFGVLEVISTIMLNFVALHLISWLVRGPLQEPTRVYPQSSSIADGVRLIRLLPGERLHAGLVIAVLAAAAMWWVLRHTAVGFRVRAVGASPSAARSAGMIDVPRVTAGAFLVSGALAGIAGASEVAGVTFALYENISPGYGFTAIAVAILARLDPRLVIVTGVLFGALESGALAMQRDAGVPSVLVSVLEALLILGVLVAERVRGGRWLGTGGRSSPIAAPPAAPATPATPSSAGAA